MLSRRDLHDERRAGVTRRAAGEQADASPALLEGVNCLGAVRVEYSVPEGLHREILFVHDLWLPDDFKPANEIRAQLREWNPDLGEAPDALILVNEFQHAFPEKYPARHQPDQDRCGRCVARGIGKPAPCLCQRADLLL